MFTSGQAVFFRQNVNTFIGLAFVASFALMMGLAIWHAASGKNPIADLLAQNALIQSAEQ